MKASPHSRLPRCSVCGSACYWSYLKEFNLRRDGYIVRGFVTCTPACESLLRLRVATTPSCELLEVPKPGAKQD